jgi:hypothetical protein
MKHGASLFSIYSDWFVAKSAGKDTQSFLNDNAKSEKKCYTSVNIPFVSS